MRNDGAADDYNLPIPRSTSQELSSVGLKRYSQANMTVGATFAVQSDVNSGRVASVLGGPYWVDLLRRPIELVTGAPESHPPAGTSNRALGCNGTPAGNAGRAEIVYVAQEAIYEE